MPGGTSLALSWRQPEKPNGRIRAYLIHFKVNKNILINILNLFIIYLKEIFSQKPSRQIRLEAKQTNIENELLNKTTPSFTVFAFNLVILAFKKFLKIIKNKILS